MTESKLLDARLPDLIRLARWLKVPWEGRSHRTLAGELAFYCSGFGSRWAPAMYN